MRTVLAPACALALVLVFINLGGCAMAIQRSRVANAFVAQFDCPVSTVRSSPGGYRVEGCGTIAFYHCSQPHYRSDWLYPRYRENAAVGMFGDLVDLALTPGDCFLEHQRSALYPRTGRTEQTVDRAALNVITPAEHARVRGRVRFLGGQLELLAIPGKYPDHVLLTVHGDHRLHYDDCQPQILRDGRPLLFTARRAREPYDMLLVVPAEQLRNLHQAARMGGYVCGLRFELGERERQALESFELRRQNVHMQLSTRAQE
jgi:hypothetical protein